MHYTGLNNIGNTCFFNSILQLLYQCTILNKIILTEKISGEFINIYLDFLKQYNISCNAITPINIIKYISKKLNRTKSSQEDAEEYLNCIIDMLLEELLKNKNYKIITNKQINYKNIVNHLFTINMNKTIYCCNCNYQSTTKEKTNILYLSIDENLKQSLTKYSIETVEWICEKCKHNQCIIKRHFTNLPKYLIILIKRFNNNNQKNNELMNMYQQFSLNNNIYLLRGIVYQMGSTTGGHYIYYGLTDKWRIYDDANITLIKTLDTNTGYLYLFVKK